MLISPVLVLMSGSATVFITTQVEQITQKVALLGVFSPLISFLLKFLALCFDLGFVYDSLHYYAQYQGEF